MISNCYYYAPHNHCLLTQHLDTDLRRMRELGTDAVSVCVQEAQLVNWHQRRLRTVVDRAHEHGLTVHAVPNRWGGLTAGWLDGFSGWTLNHRHTFLPDGEGEGFSDPSHPEVRAHFEKHLARLLGEWDFDGLIWDEPRPPRPEIVAFLDQMSAFAKGVRGDVVVSLFAEAGDLHLADPLAATKHIDYLGADGHVRSEVHQMHRMKNTIWRTHNAFAEPLVAAGKKTVFLLEAQRHRDEDLGDYLANVDRAFALPMDHLVWYYSAHEMSPAFEAAFNKATWRAAARAKQRD